MGKKKSRALCFRLDASDETALNALASRVRLDRSKTLRSLVRIGTQLLDEKELEAFDFHEERPLKGSGEKGPRKRTRLMKHLAALLVMAGFAGCAAVGNKAITDDKVIAKIVKGQSKKADVEKLIGKPGAVDFTDDGKFEKWVYTYSKSQIRGTSFIPIAGSFVGGSDVRVDTLTIQFDEAGVVKNVGRGQTLGGGGGVQDVDRGSVPMDGSSPDTQKAEPKSKLPKDYVPPTAQ